MGGRFAAAFAAGLLAPNADAQLPPMPAKPVAPSRAPASVVLDLEAASQIEARTAPVFVDRIVVEGRDPDARRTPRRPVETRFAEALAAPARPAFVARHAKVLDGTPCTGTQAQRAEIGTQWRLYDFCP